jgi:curved DNA-binding protein CbpA
MEDLYKILQVAPGADREAIQAAYERLKAAGGAVATADLDHAFAVLSDPQRRRVYDHSRIDPRGLRALFNIEGRKEKVVWNIEGRKGEEPPPPAAPLDPWGLDKRAPDEPFDGEVVLVDPLEEESDQNEPVTAWPLAVESDDGEQSQEPPGQETFAWDEPGADPLASRDDDESPSVEPEPEPERVRATTPKTAKPRPAKAKPVRKKPAKRVAATNGQTPASTGAKSKKTTRRPKANPKDSPRHARTAASQLLATPLDLEAVTLTSYNPDDYVKEKPPSWWNPLDLLSLFSFVIFIVAAAGGVYYLWDSTQGEDEPALVDRGDIDPALAPPPVIAGGVVLPQALQDGARAHVEGFAGLLGERYDYLGATGVTLADGSYFYAAAARDRGSLDGTHQRLFFFLNESALGPDWPADSRSVAEVEALPDGRIRVAYNAYDSADLPCCASLEPVTAYFSYEGGLVSSIKDPPAQIIAR